jgi:hypothetical protein
LLTVVIRYQKRLSRNLSTLLQIFNRQTSQQANKPDFLTLQTPLKRPRLDADGSEKPVEGNDARHMLAVSILENNGFDMPKIA